ncbi:hypothetical protein PIB30_115064, partial [Stylosanthes scabra]|nr:hypothetical protein [Stylosanthes scabra]
SFRCHGFSHGNTIMENQTIQRHFQSCKDMPMSNGGPNLIHQWPIPRRSENGSKTILRVRRFLIQKRLRQNGLFLWARDNGFLFGGLRYELGQINFVF